MAEFEGTTVIEQPKFIETADRLLSQAHSPSAELDTCAEAAQEVLAALGDIASEKLVVEPPLSEQQVDHYKNSAGLVLALVQKSNAALQATERTGLFARRKPVVQATTAGTVAVTPVKTSYSGQGSDAKQ